MKKYISQINNPNFIYPNNNLAQYDIEIIHDINNNSVSGTVTNFIATKSGNNLDVTFDYTWIKNGAEPYIYNSTNLYILSLHIMDPSKTYFNPFRCVSSVTTTSVSSNTISGTGNFTITPANMGVSSFVDGLYSFLIKFIGHRAIYPVYVQQTVTTINPTPTPTPTQGINCTLIGNTQYKL